MRHRFSPDPSGRGPDTRSYPGSLPAASRNGQIAPGIVAIDAPGHTPGHLGIAISSGTESLLFAGDVLIMPDQVVHPHWTSIFDLDAQTLISTRRRLLDRAAHDRSIVFHYHFGEAGRFGRRGLQFEWERFS